MHNIDDSKQHKVAIERMQLLWDTTDEQEREELNVLFDLAEATSAGIIPSRRCRPLMPSSFGWSNWA